MRFRNIAGVATKNIKGSKVNNLFLPSPRSVRYVQSKSFSSSRVLGDSADNSNGRKNSTPYNFFENAKKFAKIAVGTISTIGAMVALYEIYDPGFTKRTSQNLCKGKRQDIPVKVKSNGNVVNRDDVVSEMKLKLGSDSKGELSLIGAGGFGKSEVVRQFALSYQKDLQNRVAADIRYALAVVILNAENAEILASQYRDFAKELGIQDARQMEPSQLRKEVDKELSHSSRQGWLIVFDNVNDAGYGKKTNYQFLREKFLPTNSKGKIVYTSRKPLKSRTHIPSLDLQASKYSLASDQNKAVKLFNIGCENNYSSVLKKNLVKELYYSPFLISRVAYYLKDAKADEEGLKKLCNELRGSDVSVVAQKVYKKSHSKLSKDAKSLLNYAAYLDVDKLEEPFLKALFTYGEDKGSRFDGALQELNDLGFFESHISNDYQMHRNFVDQVKENRDHSTSKKLVKFLSSGSFFTHGNFGEENPVKQNTQSVHHALVVLGQFLDTKQAGNYPLEVSEIRSLLASYYHVHGPYTENEAQLKKARSVLEETYPFLSETAGNDDVEKALNDEEKKAVHSYSRVLFSLGRRSFNIQTPTPGDQSYGLLERAQKYDPNGVFNIRGGTVLHGILCREQGAIEKSLQEYKLMLDPNLDEGHPYFSTDKEHHNFCHLYAAKGNNNLGSVIESYPFYTRYVTPASWKENFEMHIAQAAGLKSGEELYEKVRENAFVILDCPKKEDVLTTYGHYLLAQKNAPLEARKCFESALQSYDDGKPFDYSCAEAEHGLAMVELKAGNTEQAQLHAKKAMDIYKSLFGQTLHMPNEKYAIRQARRTLHKADAVLLAQEQQEQMVEYYSR